MLLIIYGLLISSIYSYYILPDKEGGEPKINITIYPIMYKGTVIMPYNKENALHLHHWVLYISICIVSVFFYIPDIVIGFSLGLFFQGIRYKDSFTFICKNPYN